MFTLSTPHISVNDFDVVRMEHIGRDAEKLQHVQGLLNRPGLDSFELRAISLSLGSINSVSSPSVRMESYGCTQEALKLRCEGLISGVSGAISRFIEWIINLFKGFFGMDGSKCASSEPYEVKPIKIEQGGEDTSNQKWAFAPKGLSKYFMYQTESEAVEELRNTGKSIERLGQVAGIFDNFPWNDYLTKDTVAVFKDDSGPKFIKPLFGLGTDLDDMMASGSMSDNLDPNFQGFEITTKLAIGLKVTPGGNLKMMKMGTKGDKDPAEIEVVYNVAGPYNTFARELHVTREKISRFTFNRLRKFNQNLRELRKNKDTDNAVYVANAKQIGSFYVEWINFLKVLDKLVADLDLAMDHIQAKNK